MLPVLYIYEGYLFLYNFVLWYLTEFSQCLHSFLVDSLMLPMYIIISSRNNNIFTSSLPTCVHFVSWSCLIVLTRTSGTIWSSPHIFILLITLWTSSSTILNYLRVVSLESGNGFIFNIIKHIYWFLFYLYILYEKWMLSIINTFSASTKMIM